MMTPNDMNYEQAREYILANYFDGDDAVKAVTGGDEETIAMVKAVEALTDCIERSKQFITLCKWRDRDKCADYCEGLDPTKECYIPI